MKTNSLPSWGKHFFPDARVAVIEEVIVDRYVYVHFDVNVTWPHNHNNPFLMSVLILQERE